MSYCDDENESQVQTFLYNAYEWGTAHEYGMYVVKYESNPVAFVQLHSFGDASVYVINEIGYYRMISYVTKGNLARADKPKWHVADPQIGSEKLNRALERWHTGDDFCIRRDAPTGLRGSASGPK